MRYHYTITINKKLMGIKMNIRKKLILSLSILSVTLVMAIVSVIGVLALINTDFNFGGNISFTAGEGVNATISKADVTEGALLNTTLMPEVKINSESDGSEELSKWKDINLTFPTGVNQVTISFNITNHNQVNMLAIDIGGVAGTYNNATVSVEIVHVGKGVTYSVVSSAHQETGEATPTEYYKQIIITFSKTNTSLDASVSNFNIPINLTKAEPNLPEDWLTLSADETYYSVKKGAITATKDLPTNLIIPETYNDKPVKEIGGGSLLGDYFYDTDTTLTSVIIPRTMTGIANYAFYFCRDLINADFSNCINLQTIGSSSFEFCFKLTNVNLGNCINLHTIGSDAFYYCSNLTNVNISNCESLATIGNNAFYHCSNLTNMDFSNCINLVTIGSDAFYYCSNLTNMDFSNCTSLQTIGDTAFSYCRSLTDITIPKNVTTIGVNPFTGCDNLSEIIVDSANTNFKIVDEALYDINVTKLISWPKGSTTTSITLPATLTTIGVNSFYNCNRLITIDFSNCINLQTIENSAFMSCSTLESLGISSLNNCTNLQTIESDAFSYCRSLTDITIPKNVTTIGVNPFTGCDNLSEIIVDSANTNFKIVDEALYDINVTKLISWPKGSDTTSLTLPSTVTRIWSCVFYNCINLTNIDISNCNLQSIGSSAFAGCTSLTNLNLSNCTNLTEIGYHPFYNCVMDLDFSNCISLTEISHDAFKLYKGSNLILPSSVTNIRNQSFYGSTVTSVTFMDPNGWKAGDVELDLSDPVQNAEYLKTTYIGKDWTKE